MDQPTMDLNFRYSEPEQTFPLLCWPFRHFVTAKEICLIQVLFKCGEHPSRAENIERTCIETEGASLLRPSWTLVLINGFFKTKFGEPGSNPGPHAWGNALTLSYPSKPEVHGWWFQGAVKPDPAILVKLLVWLKQIFKCIFLHEIFQLSGIHIMLRPFKLDPFSNVFIWRVWSF
jgi:hypothetical protein